MKKAEGKAKFQKLLLTDLPPELIHYIFSFATLDQARLLASTSKLMKTIGVTYLYHVCSLALCSLYESSFGVPIDTERPVAVFHSHELGKKISQRIHTARIGFNREGAGLRVRSAQRFLCLPPRPCQCHTET